MLDNLDERLDEDVESAWEVEILKRIKEPDEGKFKLVPWSEVRRRIAALDRIGTDIRSSGCCYRAAEKRFLEAISPEDKGNVACELLFLTAAFSRRVMTKGGGYYDKRRLAAAHHG